MPQYIFKKIKIKIKTQKWANKDSEIFKRVLLHPNSLSYIIHKRCTYYWVRRLQHWDILTSCHRRQRCCLVTHTVSIHKLLLAFQLFFIYYSLNNLFYIILSTIPFTSFPTFNLHISKLSTRNRHNTPPQLSTYIVHNTPCGQY